MTKDYKKWIFLAPLGLLLTGLGIAVILEAFHLKNSSFSKWFIWGTLGLIIFNSGLSIFGQSIIHKTKDEILKEKR
jgi:hypothetical protein